MRDDIEIQTSVLWVWAGCFVTAFVCGYILISDYYGWTEANQRPAYEKPDRAPQRMQVEILNPCDGSIFK